MRLDNIIAIRDSKTIYRDGDKLIKVFNKEYSKADVLNEALNQARVEETELKVPQIFEVTKINDKWAIISEYIEGKTLEQLMKENPNKYNEYLELFVDLQLKMHAQRVPLLSKLKDKMLRKISQTDLDATIRYDLQTRLEGMPKHDKVCHGDFNSSNIIISSNGDKYIIDWAHATRGNASADVAGTYLLLRLYDKIDIAEKYLDLFVNKTSTSKHYIQKWLPLVVASQISKYNNDERKFLMNWINVIEYQ